MQTRGRRRGESAAVIAGRVRRQIRCRIGDRKTKRHLVAEAPGQTSQLFHLLRGQKGRGCGALGAEVGRGGNEL